MRHSNGSDTSAYATTDGKELFKNHGYFAFIYNRKKSNGLKRLPVVVRVAFPSVTEIKIKPQKYMISFWDRLLLP